MYVYAEEVFIDNFLFNAAIFITVAAAMKKNFLSAIMAAIFCSLYDVAAIMFDINNSFATKLIILTISSIIITKLSSLNEIVATSIIVVIVGYCAGGAVFAINYNGNVNVNTVGITGKFFYFKAFAAMASGLLFFNFVFSIWRKNVQIKTKTIQKRIIGHTEPICFLVDSGNLAKAPDGKSVVFVGEELFKLLKVENAQCKIEENTAAYFNDKTKVYEAYKNYIIGIRDNKLNKIIWLAPLELNDRRFAGICAPETIDEGEYIWSK